MAVTVKEAMTPHVKVSIVVTQKPGCLRGLALYIANEVVACLGEWRPERGKDKQAVSALRVAAQTNC